MPKIKQKLMYSLLSIHKPHHHHQMRKL